jgi:exonuclease SbcC
MINRVEMINWRAYDQRLIDFAPGINFIMGANGIGKTSVLEAIAYALTGESWIVKKRGKLLRDLDKSAVVRLTFTIDGEEYQVERVQSAERAGSAELKHGNKTLATNQTRVTEKIEQLIGVSADFLRRIVYMAEGDVFRFLDEPPGEAINDQIRRVLGLTQMNTFIEGLQIAEKHLKGRIKEIQGLLNDLDKLGVRKEGTLEQQLQVMEIRHKSLLAETQTIQGRLIQSEHENSDLIRLQQILNDILPILQSDGLLWDTMQKMSPSEANDHLERQLEQSRSAIQESQVTQARLEGEQSAHQRILDLLLPYLDRAETLPCPVCGKQMTEDERKGIVADIQANVAHANQQISALREKQAVDSRLQKTWRSRAEASRSLRNMLSHTTMPFLVDGPIAELSKETSDHLSGFQDQTRKSNEQIQMLERQMETLEKDRASHLAMKKQLENLGYSSPEEASEALVGLEIRALSIRASAKAASETLTAQQTTDLQGIYGQIAQVWSAFLGEDNWHLQLNLDGMPILKNKEGREFDLSQFSGGEKTALLVILHTIIAHHFSKSDFLLIDEPLEHLDSINRRSLINFLVSTYRRGGFDQAIIATFEESLIRKYMSQDGISVIHLTP